MYMNEEDWNRYFESKEFKAILEKYEIMLLEGVTVYFEAEQLTDIAEYYSKNGDLKKASDAIELALRMHPGSTDPMIFKARTFMIRGNLQSAYEWAESIPDQADREVAFLYAELMIAENRPDDASDYMEKKLLQGEFDDDDGEKYNTIHDIALLFMDNQFYEQGMLWAKKLLHFALCMQLYPDEIIRAKEMLATCYMGCEKLDEAVTLLNEVIDEDPYNHRAWLVLGDIKAFMQEWDQAIDCYDYVLAIDAEHHMAMLSKANCFVKLANYEKAYTLFDRLLESGYSPSLVHFSYGLALNLHGKFGQAVPHFMQSWESPEDDDMLFESCYNLCVSYLGEGNVVEAVRFYHLTKELSPDSPEVADLTAMFQSCLDKIKKLEAASEEEETNEKND